VRIVSLLPSATEIVYALGLGEQLVGVTHECDYPPDALTKPRLTRSAIEAKPRDGETLAKAIDREVRASVHAAHSLYGIDAEMLSQLQPDLIVTQELCEVCAVSAGLLQRTLAGISSSAKVIALEPMSLDGVFDTIRQVGDATGTDERAEDVIAGLIGRLEALARATHERGERPRTFVLEWTDPPFAAGHWTPELVEIAGGTPVLCFPKQSSRTVAWDEIIGVDPECIIIAPCGMGIEATQSAIEELDATSEGWQRLTTSKPRHVAVVDGNQFVNRPGPRLVETAELFADAIRQVIPVSS
jgi:iron complex transport system substrate-binding protein